MTSLAPPPTPVTSSLTLTPIGVLRTPFTDRVSAPRQTYVSRDVPGTIVLESGRNFEHALEDVASWELLWVLYWFHANEGWRPKVLPPRSRVRRGVFATRSPHRPVPIGMSVVRCVRVEGLTVHVLGVDMLDGTPVLDIKPYVAAADSFAAAGAGWLSAPDPIEAYEVSWSSNAREQVEWLRTVHAIDVATPVERALALGPEPHAYRRIRRHADGTSTLAAQDWRVDFVAGEGRKLVVIAIRTGYKARDLDGSQVAVVAVHREFCRRFPPREGG